jgi:hypothetical protein
MDVTVRVELVAGDAAVSRYIGQVTLPAGGDGRDVLDRRVVERRVDGLVGAEMVTERDSSMAVEATPLNDVRAMVEPGPPEHLLFLSDPSNRRALDRVARDARLRDLGCEAVDFLQLCIRQPWISRAQSKPRVVQRGIGIREPPFECARYPVELEQSGLNPTLVSPAQPIGVRSQRCQCLVVQLLLVGRSDIG